MFLYCAVDERGRTVESYLSPDARCGCGKGILPQSTEAPCEPRSITLDGLNRVTRLRRMGMRNEFNFRWANPIKIRSCKYPNNIVEQDHRPIKATVQPMLSFRKFYNARRLLIGIELLYTLHKRQYRVPSSFGHTPGKMYSRLDQTMVTQHNLRNEQHVE